MAEDPTRVPMREDDAPADRQEDLVARGHPGHPLDALSTRALRRLARRADHHRRRDVTRFEALARDAGIPLRQLRLLADAWAEGGPSGLRSIGPTQMYDELLMARAEDVIETWRRRHFPLDALQAERWRNRITVMWLTPGADRGGALDRHPLMQMRHTTDGRWHLYRRAVQGEWWPVVVRGRRRRQSLSACLDTVRVDPLHHFWGHAGPPDDLADGDALPSVPRSEDPGGSGAS